MLIAFKYTSNQVAIRRVRNQIKANLLALSLFKDDVRVAFGVQFGLLRSAGKLLALSLVPMLVMLVPMCVLLGQLALWFQARPLAVGEDAVVTVHVAEGSDEFWQDIHLLPPDSATVLAGPVRVPTKNLICWKIQPVMPGQHQLEFAVGDQLFTKELAVGKGYMPVSIERPGWSWSMALRHPHEQPFAADSFVQSIEVEYPKRHSWTTGSDSWMLYWLGLSMTAAFVARPLLRVDI
jgi:hypothetical protein